MFNKVLAIATLSLPMSLLPLAAQASIVTWQADGHISEASGYTEFKAGDAFSVSWTFDTDAALLRTRNNRNELDPSSLQISYRIGNGFSGTLRHDVNYGGLFYLRDNQPVPGGGSDAGLIDGLTFGLNSAQFPGGVTMIMRWRDLAVIQNGKVPALPPALLNMEANSFQGGDGDKYAFVGQFEHMAAVPEAETWAMLGLGLIALAGLRRRRQRA